MRIRIKLSQQRKYDPFARRKIKGKKGDWKK